jgi:hypothetical protein
VWVPFQSQSVATVDVYFFKVAATAKPPQEATLRKLVSEHQGVFTQCDPFDGQEHGYIELGAWIGDQGLALQFMGACVLAGFCEILTPKMLPGLPENLMQQMAGAGLVTLFLKRKQVT